MLPAPVPDTKRLRKILVVDDSPMMLDMTRMALRRSGFEVVTAQDMAALAQAKKRGPFDLVLMDVQMPELLGDAVAKSLARGRDTQAPIFLMSSMEESELQQRCKNAGAAGYILKRDGMASLVRRVTEALK